MHLPESGNFGIVEEPETQSFLGKDGVLTDKLMFCVAVGGVFNNGSSFMSHRDPTYKERQLERIKEIADTVGLRNQAGDVVVFSKGEPVYPDFNTLSIYNRNLGRLVSVTYLEALNDIIDTLKKTFTNARIHQLKYYLGTNGQDFAVVDKVQRLAYTTRTKLSF